MAPILDPPWGQGKGMGREEFKELAWGLEQLETKLINQISILIAPLSAQLQDSNPDGTDG